MSENFDTLGRRIPKLIETTPRQWVVAVGSAAEEILSEGYGLEPSQELIGLYVEKVKGTPEEKMVLNRRANLKIKREFEDEFHKLINQGMDVSEAQRRANESIKERYESLGEAPQNNFAFLDPILFPRGIGES